MQLRKLSSHKGSLASFVSADPLVEIIAYCLNPNHYHLILKQVSERGIEKFMHKVSTGYTNYFNKKNERSGSLFQGPFKAIHVDSNEYLLYLSAYVNRNHFIHSYEDKGAKLPNGSLAPLDGWKYCSAPDYLGKRSGTLCNKDVVLGQFEDWKLSSPFGSLASSMAYEKFLEDNALYLKGKKLAVRYCLE